MVLSSSSLHSLTLCHSSWQPSPISTINGTDAIDYLTRFAALNSYGTAEPHADWNLLFDNPVVDVLGDFFPLWSGGATVRTLTTAMYCTRTKADLSAFPVVLPGRQLHIHIRT